MLNYWKVPKYYDWYCEPPKPGPKKFLVQQKFLILSRKKQPSSIFNTFVKKATSGVLFEELIITPTKFVIISLKSYFMRSFKRIDNLKPHFLHFVISFSTLIESLFVILLEILKSFATILLLFVVFSFRKIFIYFTTFSLNLFFVLWIISCWQIFRHIYLKETCEKKFCKKVTKKVKMF